MKATASKAAASFLARAGPAALALSVLALVSLKVGGLGALARGGPYAALIVLTFGYVVETFVGGRLAACAFGILAASCGAYIAWISPANWPAGLLAAAAGAIAVWKGLL
jgi:hypothetical protein